MLHADEHMSTIGREGDPCNLAIRRAREESTHLSGAGVAGQHLVVAHAGQLAFVHLRGVSVRLDPQQTIGAKSDAVGTSKHIATNIALGLGPLIGWVAGETLISDVMWADARVHWHGWHWLVPALFASGVLLWGRWRQARQAATAPVGEDAG